MSHTPSSPSSPEPQPQGAAPSSEALRIAREKQLHQQQRAEGRRKHQRASGRDMVLSMAVIMVPVLLIAWWFTRVPSRPPVTPVDVTASTRLARSQAHMPIWVPASMPSGWVPVRADWAPAHTDLLGHGSVDADTWVVGYQAPGDHYFELDQQAGNQPNFVDDFTAHARADGTVQLGGATWTRYVRPDGSQHYLARSEGSGAAAKDTLIVGSKQGYDALADFATSLSSTAQPSR